MADQPPLQELLPRHAELLRTSGIAPEVLAARGYRSITIKAELRRLGFFEIQCRVPALLIPIYGVTGDLVTYQIRPDEPRVDHKGKVVKYETPAHSSMALDVPKLARSWLGDPSRPLFITEGARKADAAVSRELCCIAVLGVWNWRGTNEHGGKVALPDWELVALNERHVYICFDSDLMNKPQVHRALVRLKGFLERKGAHVSLIYLPAGEDGAKVGLDDYFAAAYTPQDLLDLATIALHEPPQDEVSPEHPYREEHGQLWWLKPTQNGDVAIPLTNFTARIVADTLEDDGIERRRFFEIEATLHEEVMRFPVPADHFGAMTWPTTHLGAQALLYPGFGLKEHARAAIQLLSADVVKRRVFTHTGWRQMASGVWCYLHGGGAVGATGPVPGVEVRLPDGLDRFMLPNPPERASLVTIVRASLHLLDLAPDPITVPTWAAVWRAVLGSVDCSQHLSGPTGEGKTELAALIQQHFGAGFDARHVPGSWSSTGNALEALAFAVKDAVLVIDDFAPGGAQADIARLHREADRVLRAQGNLSGRQRLRPDATLKPPKPPRGLILSTGEDVPRGQSLRARVLVSELSPGDLDWGRLTRCQQDAANGFYAQAMAGFLRWLAPRYEQTHQGLRHEIAELRQQALRSGQHRRTPEIVANLAVGLRHFLAFAQEVGALTAEDCQRVWKRCWNALGIAADAQVRYQEASEPTRRFLALLAAAIASGRAHVANPKGDAPETPEAWGWRRIVIGTKPYAHEEWQPQGKRVGWIDGDDLYLEPEIAYAEAQALAREGGDRIVVSAQTLRSRLHQRKLLASVDEKRETLKVRRTLEGVLRPVLHMRAQTFRSYISQKPDKPDNDPQETGTTSGFEAEMSDAMSGADDHPKSDPTSHNNENSNSYVPHVGFVGLHEGETCHQAGEKDAVASSRSGFQEKPDIEPDTQPDKALAMPREVFDI